MTPIERVRVHHISAPLEKPFWMSLEPYTTSSELLVEIEDKDGAVGYGQVHGRPLDVISDLVVSALAPRILGRDPLETNAIWSDLFALTHSRASAEYSAAEGQPHFGGGVSPQMMAAIAGIDIALWDLKGKQIGVPVFRLLGGDDPVVPVYASGGYYRGGDPRVEIVEEAGWYVDEGFTSFKMKVGGLSIGEDAERIRAVRSEYPDLTIMLDANSAYSVEDAIDAAHAFAPFDIEWFEEPLHWYDPVFGLGKVSSATTIPTASGESALHRWACRDLIDHSGIRIMQFDATRAGGITEWMRVASYAAHHGLLMAPHHDPQIHGHMVAAVDNGHVLEFFPNKRRDPLWFELYQTQPQIASGLCTLPDEPGLGFSFDWQAVERRRVGDPRVAQE